MRKAFLFVLIVIVAALATLTGCSSSKTTPATQPVKSTGPTSVVPQEQQVIYNYYKAVNEKRYKDAFNLASGRFKSQYGSLSDFEATYRDFVNSVKVVSLTRLDQFSTGTLIEFRAVYDATYIKPYPAGDGKLPTINTVVPDATNQNRWMIDEISTGP